MKTDDLIAALAADTLPRLSPGQRLGPISQLPNRLIECLHWLGLGEVLSDIALEQFNVILHRPHPLRQ